MVRVSRCNASLQGKTFSRGMENAQRPGFFNPGLRAARLDKTPSAHKKKSGNYRFAVDPVLPGPENRLCKTSASTAFPRPMRDSRCCARRMAAST